MSTFYDNDITNKGRELLAELMSGASFRPTRIVIGQGYLPIGTTARNITDVISPVATMEINKSTKIEPSGEIPEGCYVIGGMFSNAEITADFNFRELGLYAKAIRLDGTETAEILYSYGNAGDDSERIPAYSTTTVIEKQMDLITYVGNDTAVTLQVNSGIYVTQEEFDDVVAQILVDIEAATSTDYTATLSTRWSGTAALYTQDVAINGITSTDNPIIDFVPSTTDWETQETEWAKIVKAESYDGGIKFYAKEKTTTDLPIIVKGFGAVGESTPPSTPPPTPPLEIVTWSTGTDAQIAAMVAALEDGTLTVEDTGWAVGDKRTVQLSAMAATGVGESHEAQTVEFVLSHAGATAGITRADGKPIHFQVDQVSSLKEAGYMNKTDTNSGSWSGCARRTWCNAIYYAAIPDALRPIFKQMRVTTAEIYNGTTLQETEDFFALRAEMEVFGFQDSSNTTEAAALEQVEWYKTAANRDIAWERSPYARGGSGFCKVSPGGVAHNGSASSTHGLAPFGCI